ncbi:MAG: dihydroxyacetone kinase subunit DhaK [Phyllobacteriaceae bacterium]|nr:dihydroxyacetone kinase subunit DhaK [Phyllobacteriaceae bacterium]
MKKLINDPADYVTQSLEGMIAAYPDVHRLAERSRRVVERSVAKQAGKVGVASGGGFGHLPLFAGYVGKGLLDSCAVGDVFAGPAADDVAAALSAADFGAGVLSVIGNYGGDRMTFEMQTELARASQKDAEIVIVNDDVASASANQAGKRRGVAGIVLAFKIAGAAAEAGHPLAEVKRLTQGAIDNMRSIGVALDACVLPHTGCPSFDLPENMIEMGMGIHGEQGVWRGDMRSADDLAKEMLQRLTDDMPLSSGDEVTILCNSLGATPLDELFIIYRRVSQLLTEMNLTIVMPRVGHYATSMEMSGASVTVMRLDKERRELLGAPAFCPAWGCK